jgi:hypothetical protein
MPLANASAFCRYIGVDKGVDKNVAVKASTSNNEAYRLFRREIRLASSNMASS